MSLKQKILENAESIFRCEKCLGEIPSYQKKHFANGHVCNGQVVEHRLVSVDVVSSLLDKAIAEIKNSPFRRMDMQIEGEVRNARRNWKRCKKKGTNQVTDEDFERILKTMRIKIDDVLSVLGVVEAEKQK